MGQQLLSRDSLDYFSDTVTDRSILDDMSTDDEQLLVEQQDFSNFLFKKKNGL